MKFDWVPYSASALVAGAIALAMGGLLTPTVGDSADSLQIVQQEGGRWLAVSVLYFGAAVAMTVGLPSALTLLGPRSGKIGLVGVSVFAIGCIGTAGYAMLLVFFRALALTGSIEEGGLDTLTQDVGLGAFLVVWVGAFYLGETLIAWALLRSLSTPRWVPVLLLLHVISLPVSMLLPPQLSEFAVLLVTIGLCGIGISATQTPERHTVRTT